MKKTRAIHGDVAVKLDMSKAFDKMEWSFITKILQRFGFSEKWCQLVDQCISTASISILLSGSPIETMIPTRGLRQGDILSPYRFVICMESFSRMIQTEVEKKNIIPIYLARTGPPVSRLFFADDCILFSTAKKSSIDNLQRVIHSFCKVSVQMVNLGKSSLHFSKRLSEEAKKYVCDTMGMNIMPLDEKYLGINLFIGRKTTKCFSNIQEKMQKRIQQWQAGMVNQLGRSSQIQSVTDYMAQFQMRCFILPQQTINQLEATQRRLVQEKGKNWDLILEARYFKQENILQEDFSDKGTEIWKSIVKGIEWVLCHSNITVRGTNSNTNNCNPPHRGMLKINIDASVLLESHFAGIALIIRDFTGQLVEAWTMIERVRDLPQAEAIAALKAL
ncbi:uncharacterized protein LOC113272718 [Papaver somniferum]|uniref:uncharacterized protein LOC113272718 n=1 Tax=Papaver somniferum TaxID=3469 RepID=UPI000E6FC4E3|nr:uncharacterized protein LOC113272718 [Papaver somniferum]